jgi:hypothetical protein
MTLNFPGPHQVDIHYAVDGLDHVQKLNCELLEFPDPGITFSDVHVIVRAGTNPTLAAAVDAWVTLIKARFAADCEITHAEAFVCGVGNFDRTWLGTYAIGVDGTHAGVYAPASEVTHTYRTAEGGILKLTWEESTIDFFAKTSLGAATSYEAAIRDFVVSDANWILGRDTSYPIAGYNLLYGQNEAIFKRRYR